MMAVEEQGSEAEWCFALTEVLCILPTPGREERIQPFCFSTLQQSKCPCLGLGTVALLPWILCPQSARLSVLASENGKLGLSPRPLD